MPQPVTDPSVIEGYLTDASNMPGFADGLLRPSSTEEVAAIVRHCQEHGIALTVSAGRTSTTAAAVPHGGWILSMERLNQIHHIGHDTAIADGGVFLGQFQTEIEATGRFFPPDPTSRHEATLGAAIACNASGARSFKYGPTRPWVQALTVVLPTGDVVTVERGDPVPGDWPIPAWAEPQVKTAAGYAPAADAVDVFIGQEGTLGIITQATVRLTDLPSDVLGVLAYFPSRAALLTFVDVTRTAARADRSGALSPRCLEYYDANCLQLARERVGGVPDDAVCALFCEQEVVPGIGEDEHMGAWWEALTDAGAIADDTLLATDGPTRETLLSLRHAIPAGVNEEVIANGMPKVGTDLAVPDAALEQIMDAYEAAPMRHVLFGHIGDNHLHLNLLPKTAEQLAEAKAFYGQLVHQTIDLGGTVSAEHGIGKIKVDYLASMVGPETLADFRALKKRLDPAWILGRGTLLAP